MGDSSELIPNFETIQGVAVVLRPFTVDDLTPTYVDWLNDPQIVRYSNQRFYQHSLDSCRNYFESFEKSPNRLLTIVRKQDAQMVGTMTAYAAVPHGTVDMGIMIGCRSAWGKGLGQDAWTTLLNWLLGEPRIRKVTGGSMRCNLAMVRIMERAGMSLEAIRSRHEVLDGEEQDLVYFGKFRDPL